MNIPKLRFPEFSDDWEASKMGDVTSKIGSGSTPRGGEKVYTSDGILFIRSQNVKRNILDLTDSTFIPEEVHFQMSGSEVKSNDVLLNITGASIGRSCVVPSSVITGNVNQHVCIVRTGRHLESNFLQSFLASHRGQKLIYQGQTGSGREGLNFQSIRSFKLNLPTNLEQTKIAAFLTEVDNKIEQLSKKQELLGEYKKGLMQQIFSQTIRFKANDGSEFPDWEEKELGNIGQTFNGLTGKTKDDFGRGKPYIQYMQIFNSSKINIDNFGLVNVRNDEHQMVVQYGDVFFTTSSEVPDAIGHSSVLLDDIDELYLNSFCFGFRPNSLDELTPNFAQFLLRNANFRRRVVRLAQGSTRFNMSKVQLMKELVDIPSVEEQTKIANFLSSIDNKIEQVGKQLDESKQFKKALLQQMFV